MKWKSDYPQIDHNIDSECQKKNGTIRIEPFF